MTMRDYSEWGNGWYRDENGYFTRDWEQDQKNILESLLASGELTEFKDQEHKDSSEQILGRKIDLPIKQA
jgi:hypothetical protein